MTEQRSYSEIVSKEVMNEVKQQGIDISIPEEKVVIPSVGDKFLIERNEFEVIYINYGRARFTCIPINGLELPEVGKTFMYQGQEYFVTHLDSKKRRFVCEPYFGGNK